MAHEVVYGICENKCRVEVIPKEQLGDLTLVTMSQEDYEALSEKDANTLYITY